jgi:dolichyl-phosphate-mannose-protein mannosyltransferase
MAPAVKRRAADATAASLPASSPSTERVQAADLDVMHQGRTKEDTPQHEHPGAHLRKQQASPLERLVLRSTAHVRANPDAWLTGALVLLGLWTRLYRIRWPPECVFDEVHFASFAHHYLNRTYFFDIHPPLAKLTLAAVAKLAGDVPNLDWYIDKVYPPDSRYYAMRACAGVFGALLPPLGFRIARGMGMSRIAATSVGVFLLFDMLNLIEARHILTDSQLIFYSALCIDAFVRLWRTPPASRARRWAAVRAGLASGAALSVKWTTLVVPGLFGLESVAGAALAAEPLEWSTCAIVAATALLLYVALWYPHFRILIYNGPGGDFMSAEFQRTLIGRDGYDPQARKPPFLKLVWQLNKEMLLANARILDEHQWQARWHTWPYVGRGLLYWNRWQEGTLDADGRPLRPHHAMQIYLIGNPLLFWMCLAAVLGTVAAMPFLLRLIRQRKKRGTNTDAWERYLRLATFLLLGYALGILPYMPIQRSTFIYHYLPSLLFAELLFAHAVLDLPALPSVLQLPLAGIVWIVVFWCFWYFRAWVYGHIALTADDHEAMRWIKYTSSVGDNKGWH